MYDIGDDKIEETVDAWDYDTVNERGNYFSIYECGKSLPLNIWTSVHRIVLYQVSIKVV